MVNALSIAAYLDSIQRDYPFGIPGAAVIAPGKTKVLFIGEIAGAAPADPYQGPAGAMLKAAITKGMKIALAEAAAAVLPLDPGALAEMIATRQPRCIVCLGKAACEALAAADPAPSADVVVTRELDAVLAGIEDKRVFWEDLKKVMGMLR